MELKGKVVLIISPQSWEGQFVSKHHYALQLAKRGNDVYFLNPPVKKSTTKIEPTAYAKLNVISHSFWFNRKLRFHFRTLYDFLVKYHVKKVVEKIGGIDVVWSFEPNLYKSLNWFNADLKIYHPVDFIDEKKQIGLGKTSDFNFTVAENILEKFYFKNPPSFFINHGLPDLFYNEIEFNIKNAKSIKFAYVGNLMIRGLDKQNIIKIIVQNPTIQFDFYGSYSNEKGDDFITFLENETNATLKGIKSSSELAVLLRKYTGFLLCYNPILELNSGSNSHKILEYLSFGKVIIANKILQYENYRDLIQMSLREDNTDYVHLFNATISKINEYNSEELFTKRRTLAFENTYAKQITRIEKIISEKYNED